MLTTFRKKLLSTCLIGGLSLGVLFLSCAEDDPNLTRFVQNLVVEILAGPKDGSTLLNNEFFTFEWRALGGGGDITYEIQLTDVDVSPITTTEVSKSYPGQGEGSYTFTVTARAGSESSIDSRSFSVGGNLGPPTVVITGARGSASSGGSGVTPAYAAGQLATTSWSGNDVDKFGEVTGYRWRIADSEAFTEFTLTTLANFEVPSVPGVYNFTVEATDNLGAVSMTFLEYEVKDPAIVIVDDKPQADGRDEAAEDQFYLDLFEGFAVAQWDVAEQGIPTAADLVGIEVAVVYSLGRSELWRSIGRDFPEATTWLSDFIDSGGKLWAMGQEILEDLTADGTHANPPAATEFEAVHLHLAPATGDPAVDMALRWGIAGDQRNDLEFSFADDKLGDPVNFPRITILAQTDFVDKIFAEPGAEIVYEGKGGLGDVLGDVALRFPAGGSNTQIVFQTFPFFENRNVLAGLLSSRTLTRQIMKEMGQ